jgi:hypothetical protein
MEKKPMEQKETLEDVKQADLEDKKEIIQEAVKVASANGNAEELLRDVVRNVSLDAKQAVVAGAVTSADRNAAAILSEAVKQTSPKAMKTVLREVLEYSEDQDARNLITEAVDAAAPDAKKDLVAKAVKNSDEAQALLTEAINAAPAGAAEAAINDSKLPKPTTGTIDRIWMIVVGTFAVVLIGATAALVAAVVLDIFYEIEPAHVQIMLTMFTTVAGILAGFITGQAVGTAQERDRERG